MENINERITKEQEDVNRIRRKEGKKPVTDFKTIQFKHGFVTMSAEEFSKLPKTKAKKLMKP